MAAAGPATELLPETLDEAAAMLREAAADPAGVRICGGETKLGWGRASEAVGARLSSRALDAVIEHNEGDYTLIAQAGARLGDLQARLRSSRQRIALDPPTGPDGAATIGGVLATADAGPLRHRYGTPRDLVLGVTVALPDGTVAKSGGKVIKNVAGYDLGKLYAGSFGTLGLILRVALRLHPLPDRTETVVGRATDPGRIAAAVSALTSAPLEPEAVDVRWDDSGGAVLARVAGPSAEGLAERAEAILAAATLDVERPAEADELWAEQRRNQRGADRAVVRVSATPGRLGDVLRAVADDELSLVGRGVVGVSWIAVPGDDEEELAARITALRGRVAPSVCAVLDAPASMRRSYDVWGLDSPGEQGLMAAIRDRFDPDHRCNPGLFDGAIE